MNFSIWCQSTSFGSTYTYTEILFSNPSILANWCNGRADGKIVQTSDVLLEERITSLRVNMAANPKTVIIADDHHLIVHSLRLLVDETLGLNCVAAVHDGLRCIECASEHNPDLIILDLDLPRVRGDEAIGLLNQVSTDSKILIITAITTSRLLRDVWEAGVQGIVLKGSPVNEICEAISTVLSGQRYIGSEVSAIVSKNHAFDNKLESLTSREREVFELLLQRVSISTISTRLNVSPKTVDNHKTRVMAKLDVHSRADLMAFAVKVGFQDLILKASPE